MSPSRRETHASHLISAMTTCGPSCLFAGFTSVSMRTGYAIDSMWGVGSQLTGQEQVVSCPSGTLVTGISGGAFPGDWAKPPSGFVQTLQLYCSCEQHRSVQGRNATKALSLHHQHL
jgi:hypothetical protein